MSVGMVQVVLENDKSTIGIQASECDKEHNERINKVSQIADDPHHIGHKPMPQLCCI